VKSVGIDSRYSFPVLEGFAPLSLAYRQAPQT
jgi:hypothetical protein